VNTDRWATPDRIRELSLERFIPWPLQPAPVVNTTRKRYYPWHSIPLAESGTLSRGFVRDERFAGGGEQVIKGTNRAKTRASRALVVKERA
jgi:hypothetical protein